MVKTAQELVKQYINEWTEGDDRAFKKVFDYYQPRLVSFAARSVKSYEDAEEISLNVMLNIWNYRHRVEGILDFEDYLFGALRNQIARYYRKKMLVMEDLDMVPLQNLGSVDHPEFSLKELQQRYTDALDQLPPKQKEIFILSREQGLSQKQIADQTGLSVNTVNNHITTSLKFLRKKFQDNPEAFSMLLIVGSTAQIIR